MQELLGRITSLDPEASESLKVIGYFDALVEAHANTEVLLRGARLLSGCACGFVAGGLVVRVSADDERDLAAAAPPPGLWAEHPLSGDWRAWLEREGPPHANDAMVLERLALGLAIALERSHPVAIARRSLEVLLSDDASQTDRSVAAKRLRLDPRASVRVCAVPVSTHIGQAVANAVVETSVGPVRAVIQTSVELPAGRAGIGLPARPADLPDSWASALVALRMSSEREPVIDASTLGSLLLLAQAADSASLPQPDVVALDEIAARDPRALAQLDAVAECESLRSAAGVAGIHHSTLQAHVADWSDTLGFDLRSPAGQVRLSLALRLQRLASFRAVYHRAV